MSMDLNLEDAVRENAMDVDVDAEEYSLELPISSSLPTSFLSTPRAIGRRVSTPALESPTRHPLTPPPPPRPKKVIDLEHWDEEHDVTATPSKSCRNAKMTSLPLILDTSPSPERSSLLGKHPHSDSPTLAEGRLRSKGPNNFHNFPKPPKFLLRETLEQAKAMKEMGSPVPIPDFSGTPAQSDLVSTSQQPPLGFSSLFEPASRRSSIASNDSENPFLGSSKPKLSFTLDYLSESQWYSDYPHHITKEYLDELFQMDKRVMFTSFKSGLRNYPDYLTTHYFVNKSSLGQGDFSDVLKVQSKANREFYAIKKLRKTVQGAYESLKGALKAQKKYGGFDERRIWKCLTDLATGLRAIHESNIIHMDLKPGNVFISASGSLKIGDFGHSIAYPVQEKDISEGDKFYMAHELLDGKCGKFSDIFSLGVMLYEMITNRTDNLPGEGPEWHKLRQGDLGLDTYLAPEEEPLGESTSTTMSRTGSSSTTALETQPESSPSTGSSLSDSVLSSPFMSEGNLVASVASGPNVANTSTPKAQARVFSGTLLELVTKLMQPQYENRPTSAMVHDEPKIKAILARRKDGHGVRVDTAMHGLLLQSI
ncbi:Protein kinase, membrane associated tyrosine threonine 1 [Podila epigama]|nr:Protein kinase, membrane associated tyrosine threonine 1 [Podila epigama]